MGVSECLDCHQPQVESWQKSHHAMAMQPATRASVLAPFAGEVFKLGQTEARFFQRDNGFWINAVTEQGERSDFKVAYTFGVMPLQQYLIEAGRGRLQAFDIAWDSRPKTEGGERWFHLQPEENPQPGHPFFWQGAFQNWNSRCADCHSTGLERGFDIDTNTYNTTFAEVNVACESCHGPASEHVRRARNQNLAIGSGLVNSTTPTIFVFKDGAAIASPQGSSDDSEMAMCGGCHSRRSLLDGHATPSKNYHDRYRIAGLQEDLYFANGQIKDEVFVLGSFLQSKMYQRGVRCSHCHDPHSGNTIASGDGLCAQCHRPDTFATEQHSRHAQDTVECVDCHMSQRLYMGVDWRRDHGFHLPSSALPGQANACQACHQDDAEVEKARLAWSSKPHWSADLQAARNYDPRAVRALSGWIKDNSQPSFVRASLLQQLASSPSRMSVELALQVLDHPDPLMRVAAIEVLQVLPPATKWPALRQLINDPSEVVRVALSSALRNISVVQLGEDQSAVESLHQSYQRMLEAGLDMPAAQLGLAELALQKGDLLKAQQHFENALAIDPTDVASLINYADFNRQLGAEDQAQQLLLRALVIAPDSALVQYSLGMSEVRRKNYSAAIAYLRAAVATGNAIPRHHYVLAVALQNQDQVAAAVDVLEKALVTWPYDYQLLTTAINFQQSLGEHSNIAKWVANLSEIAPNAPEVRSYLAR